MLKKGQLSIFVVIALLIVIAVVIKFFISQNNVEIKLDSDCLVDADCVPSDCCHATSCLPLAEAPDCSSVSCTQNCEPGTLDCGQASCGCSQGLCVVIQNEDF